MSQVGSGYPGSQLVCHLPQQRGKLCQSQGHYSHSEGQSQFLTLAAEALGALNLLQAHTPRTARSHCLPSDKKCRLMCFLSLRKCQVPGRCLPDRKRWVRREKATPSPPFPTSPGPAGPSPRTQLETQLWLGPLLGASLLVWNWFLLPSNRRMTQSSREGVPFSQPPLTQLVTDMWTLDSQACGWSVALGHTSSLAA